MAAVNWTHEEIYKLISTCSDATIQEQIEGCRRNSQVFKKISDDLCSAAFTCTLEQCREKMKKLKAEYKKVKHKRDETGQGRNPKWEYFDALNEVLGTKHSTEPPVVVEKQQKLDLMMKPRIFLELEILIQQMYPALSPVAAVHQSPGQILSLVAAVHRSPRQTLRLTRHNNLTANQGSVSRVNKKLPTPY